ncbi:MAG: DUF547 domain-containing protein [Planctomycetes bacterium]|nr:DUF547 domain-containing protein [Planctomycetota bacterium]
MRILLLVVWLFGSWFFLQEVSAQEVAEKEIFIPIHSGLKTIPVRKVIDYVIDEAEDEGVTEIVGNTKHVERDVWDIAFRFLKGKETKKLSWRYEMKKWDLQPMNAVTKSYSFPMDNYVIGPAINLALAKIENKGIQVEEIRGRGVRVQDKLWQLSLRAIDTRGVSHVQEWKYDHKHKELIPQHFDHLDLDMALASCVTAKGIKYSALKKDVHLGEFLTKAAKLDKLELAALPREEQIAFWINVYNATVLRRVAEKYPVKSVKEIKGLFGEEKLKAAGKTLTLNELQDYLLGKDFQENRVLFALVSGTRSSPPLRKEAYCGRLLERQLEEDLKSFLSQPANLYATEAGILLSPVLEPLAKRGTLRDFLNKAGSSLPPNVSKSLADGQKEVKFMEYDWGVNAGE